MTLGAISREDLLQSFPQLHISNEHLSAFELIALLNDLV